MPCHANRPFKEQLELDDNYVIKDGWLIGYAGAVKDGKWSIVHLNTKNGGTEVKG